MTGVQTCALPIYQYLYGFLDEGLTDFNTALFYDEYPEYNHSSKEIFSNAEKSYANFVKVFSEVVPNFSTKMVRKLNEFATENEYVYVAYIKGMLMFSNLNDLLGAKKMTKCIKYYFAAFALIASVRAGTILCRSPTIP